MSVSDLGSFALDSFAAGSGGESAYTAVRRIDDYSPRIAQLAAEGRTIERVDVVFGTAGMTITFKDAEIRSYEVVGNRGEVEQFTLDAESVSYEHGGAAESST